MSQVMNFLVKHISCMLWTKKYGSSQVGFFEQIFLLLVVENQTLNL